MMTRDYAAPDWRGLCLRMADELDHYRQLLADDRREVHSLAVEARAALAQPEPEVVGPSNEELASHLISAGVDAMEGGTGRMYWEGWNEQVMAAMHAAIAADRARWGRPAPAPTGEVAELVAWLRANALTVQKASGQPANGAKQRMNRAADLLERQAAPVPVAVSERLPGAEDCDAEGRCWVHQPHEACPESPAWELMSAKYASANYEALCWLPFHALPLPSGEVEA